MCVYSVISRINSSNPCAVACHAPLSMGFPRQEHWSGLPLHPPENLPDPGIERLSPVSAALAGRFFTAGPLGKPNLRHQLTFNLIKQRWSSTLLLSIDVLASR